MRMLHYDCWVDAPVPVAWPGCITVRLSAACTPGEQADIKLKLNVVQLFAKKFMKSGRFLHEVAWHVRTYGVRQTARLLKRQAASHHLREVRTCASFAGVVVDSRTGEPAGGSPRLVAGYRYRAPLCADFLTVHPDQVVDIPSGVSAEDAAAVLYYAYALEAFDRIAQWPAGPIVIHGRTLASQLLANLLEEAGRTVYVPATGDAASIRKACEMLAGGTGLVLGRWRGREPYQPWCDRPNTLFVGLDANQMSPSQWLAVEPRWIGLPHSDLRNLSIASEMPLEVDPAWLSQGLGKALGRIGASQRRPSSFTTRIEIPANPFADKSPMDLSSPRTLVLSNPRTNRVVRTAHPPVAGRPGALGVAAVGLGVWGTQTLFPVLSRQPNARIVMGVDSDPSTLQQAADLLKIPMIATDAEEAFRNPDVDAVFIATTHDCHADLAARALKAGKKVFVEKPVALDYAQLGLLLDALRTAPNPYLAVGFNRPHWLWSRLLRARIAQDGGPVSITGIVRELPIPRTHTYYWPRMGTRIVSNGCHWIDLSHFLLSDRTPIAVQVNASQGDPHRSQSNNVTVIEYADGSRVTLVFSDRGDRRPLVHEFIDIKTERSHFMVDDFRRVREFRDGINHTLYTGLSDRGWEANVVRALEGMTTGGAPPRSYHEVLVSTLLTFEARASFDAGGTLRRITPELLETYSSLPGSIRA